MDPLLHLLPERIGDVYQGGMKIAGLTPDVRRRRACLLCYPARFMALPLGLSSICIAGIIAARIH